MNENQPNTLPPEYFDHVYQANRDPWNFETSPYEREKYAATLAALPRTHYAEVFEVGCSLGVLTAQLAPRCGHLLAVDVSEAALAQARARCAALPQVEIRQMQVPDEFPSQSFDLILLSEVGYYWSPADLARAAEKFIAALQPGGQLLLVHWTPPVHDYPLTGDDVHAFFLAKTVEGGPLRHLTGQRHEQYRLDLLEKR
ncbi:class I SAM-dependent DNA methyltransferase [Hymenobacter properus]|uniref:Methyltransferase domain-containing protein n=1 Tax=Hymenobacter properus TaxID=2791026 RepID=A0A931BK67_9BACT|nr:class I SAM-dependent methyltransferase [Hymenobacter properus]MBF9143807.1 methyltransferase domain-containing protein [Hymenobacter properus]MBR7722620.1 methyltransferase domain-containing protein [Microvirga sp. SRT04]